MKSKGWLKATILVMCMLQMASNALSPILASLEEAFPDASASSIQFLMTFPSFFVIIITILAAGMSKNISKKVLLMLGLGLISVVGIGAYFVHSDLAILFMWAGIMGVGIGFIAALAISLISDFFEGREQQNLMGYQTSFANMGSMLMTFVGGMLATIHWSADYLVLPMIALPALVLCMIFVPMRPTIQGKSIEDIRRDKDGSAEKLDLNKSVWYAAIVCIGTLNLFNMGPTNLAMLISERGLGGSAISGTVVMLLMIGGIVMGFLYGPIAARIDEKTIPLGFIFQAIGMIILSVAPNIPLICVGCFIMGTSMSLITPQCMVHAISRCRENTHSMATAIIMSFSNIGTFTTPIITIIAAAIFGEGTANRFKLGFIMALCWAAFTFIVDSVGKARQKAKAA